MRDVVMHFRERGCRAFKIGRGHSADPDDPALDGAIVAAALEATGDENKLLVDASASDAYWPIGLE